ncbi:hypothetical protein Q5752_005068 [Cryptotrichosporon argae]
MARPARSAAQTPSTTPAPTRASRRQQSISASASASTPGGLALAPSTPSPAPASASPVTSDLAYASAPQLAARGVGRAAADELPVAGPGPSSRPRTAAPLIEPKTHGLRNQVQARERQACPYPADYGGKDKCQVHDEDETDDVLMAICAACAIMDNRALSPDELAAIALDRGWMRAPSVAVAPSTMINNAIRMHTSRCLKTSRRPLITKYQLTGSAAESSLASALHPAAFDGSVRPKGPVWFLSEIKGRWRDPFTGLELKAPKTQPRKSVPSQSKPKRRESKLKESVVATPSPPPAGPPRIKLRFGTAAQDDESERSGSSSRASSVAPRTQPMSITPLSNATPDRPRAQPRSHRSVLDSSDSDTSDSEVEAGPGLARGIRRRGPPMPLTISNSPRLNSPRFLPRAMHSPFGELFFSPVHVSPALPQHSPFPCHPLDNTVWDGRTGHAIERFETSSSSSDDETTAIRDQDDSSRWIFDDAEIVIKGEDDTPRWDDRETKELAAATDAMRELAAISYEGEVATGAKDEQDTVAALNALDNRLCASSASASSSFADSSSTATVHAIMAGKLKATSAVPAALPAWVLSSPVSSPNVRAAALPVETSPTAFLSRLRHFEVQPVSDVAPPPHLLAPDAMDVDDGWLDESGELPVKAEESLSDVELGSAFGDVEHERQLHTAEWAREAAASTITASTIERSLNEENDFPSPGTDGYTVSRASSSTSPSSGSSDLPPFEFDDVHTDMLGPESVPIEALEDWLPHGRERTTPRGRTNRHRATASASWGMIGVGALCKPSLTHKRSLRSSSRRNRSSICEMPPTPVTPTSSTSPESSPAPDESMDSLESMDFEDAEDGIGPADFDLARAEADAKEAAHKQAQRKKAEESRRRFEACRQAFRAAHVNAHADADTPTTAPLDSMWAEYDPTSPGIAGGALSPLAIQGMSALSLGPDTVVHSLDPRTLLSPPASATSGMDVDVRSLVTPPAAFVAQPPAPAPAPQPKKRKPVPIKAASAEPIASASALAALPAQLHASATLAVPPVSPARPSPVSSPINDTASVVTVASAPAALTSAPVVAAPAAQTAPANATAPSLPSKVASASPAPAASAVDMTSSIASLASNASAGSIKSTVSAPAATGTSTPTSTPSNASAAPSTVSAQTSVSRAATAAPGTAAPAPPPAARRPFKMFGAIDIGVVDNIPSYSFVWDKPGMSVILRRRLDSDFVNATSLLLICAVPIPQHAKLLGEPRFRPASQVTMPPSRDGHTFERGIAGVWVPLVAAREIASQYGIPETDMISKMLLEDLFDQFKIAANLHQKPLHRRSGDAFGPSFSAAVKPQQQQQQHQQQQQQQPANLSASLPRAMAKPLVRPAPQVPDGCPMPKRRRATFIASTAQPPKPRAIPRAAAVGRAAGATGAAQPTGPVVKPGTPVGAAQKVGSGGASAPSAPDTPSVVVPARMLARKAQPAKPATQSTNAAATMARPATANTGPALTKPPVEVAEIRPVVVGVGTRASPAGVAARIGK